MDISPETHVYNMQLLLALDPGFGALVAHPLHAIQVRDRRLLAPGLMYVYKLQG